MSGHPEFLLPDWPAPPAVRAAVTTRGGGFSTGPYASFNLATHVGDDLRDVEAGRAAGMKVAAAKWGYLNGGTVESWNADWVLEKPRDLMRFL